jgi:hypothetical protein
MTLAELRDTLSPYPDDHPHLEMTRDLDLYDSEALAFTAMDTPSTVGAWRADLTKLGNSTIEWTKGGLRHINGKTEVLVAESGECGEPMTRALLRAWLGPVPVVLPDGCEVWMKGRRYNVCKSLVITHIQGITTVCGTTSGQLVALDPAAMEWVRTGNISGDYPAWMNNNGETTP